MMLGFVTLAGKGAADRLLAETACLAEARGLPLVAMVRAFPDAAKPGEMFLRLAPSGRIVPIKQSLGAGSGACTLDSDALERCSALTLAAIEAAGPGTAVILNKFSKAEAGGHGARPLIAAALERDLPVLIAVPAAARADFDAFAGGMAQALAADPSALARALWPAAAPPKAL